MAKPGQNQNIRLGNKGSYKKANPELASVKKAYQDAEDKVEREKLERELKEVWD